MPGERSLYRKMQVVLDQCSSVRHNSVDALVASLASTTPLNFVYRLRNPEGNMVAACSENSIRRTVRLCIELALLDSTGVLTDAGLAACNHLRFPQVVGQQVIVYLANSFDITLDRVFTIVSRGLLWQDPPRLSSAENIWEMLGSPESPNLDDLRRYLYLLAQCDVIKVSQRRIYLQK